MSDDPPKTVCRKLGKTQRHQGFAGDSSSYYWFGATEFIYPDQTRRGVLVIGALNVACKICRFNNIYTVRRLTAVLPAHEGSHPS